MAKYGTSPKYTTEIQAEMVLGKNIPPEIKQKIGCF
jgi:hypothetical protein